MQNFPIKIRSIRINHYSNSDSTGRLKILFVASELNQQQRILCQNLSAKLSVDLQNFNAWKEFKKYKHDETSDTIVIVQQQFAQTAISFVQTRPNIKAILITNSITNFIGKESYQKFSLIVQQPKDILAYVKDIQKEKENILRESNQYLRSSITSPIKYKPTLQEQNWQKRVLRAMAQNGIM